MAAILYPTWQNFTNFTWVVERIHETWACAEELCLVALQVESKGGFCLYNLCHPSFKLFSLFP